MVSRAARPLNLGLRRDIRVFLLVLTAFLVCVIGMLLIALQMSNLRGEAATRERWETAADAIEERFGGADLESRLTSDAALAWARPKFEVTAIEITTNGQRVLSGFKGANAQSVTRTIGSSTVALWFDGSELRSHRRRFAALATICLVSVVAATILLLLYVPKITGPFEQMLEQARRVEEGEAPPGGDEAKYVIDSFRRTIERLETSESELRAMHAKEKTRADDLERVSATLTRSLSSGFLSVDPAGRIAEINSAGAEILGVANPSDIMGQPIGSALAEPFSDLLRRSLDEGTGFTRTELRQPVGDEVIDIGLTIVPLRGRSDELIGVLALFTNLTPIHKLEERVRALQTLADLGEIAAGVAHELRNSLSTIMGYVKLARRESPDPAVDAKLASAQEEGNRLADAVTSLLNFSRPFTLEMQTLDLGETTRAIATRLHESASDVPLHCDIESATAHADATLISRAIENGLRNAIESVREKGSGEVSVMVRAQPEPRIVIRDTGTGLDDADVPRLFLPFQSERAGGFGLGLSLIRKIVLLHQGSVELSGAKGEGAALTIVLPFVSTEESSPNV